MCSSDLIGKWVWVTSQMIEDESCKASVGKQKGFTHPLAGDGKYTLNGIISMSCENPEGAAIHELGHVIGLFHEHMRADRGKYVSVGDGYGKNYDIVRDGSVGTHGTMFDTKSVMIYWNVIDKGSGKEVGYNQTLSAGDIKTVNRMYPNPEKGEEILKKILPDVRSERFENSSLSAGLGYDGLNELSTQNQP